MSAIVTRETWHHLVSIRVRSEHGYSRNGDLLNAEDVASLIADLSALLRDFVCEQKRAEAYADKWMWVHQIVGMSEEDAEKWESRAPESIGCFLKMAGQGLDRCVISDPLRICIMLDWLAANPGNPFATQIGTIRALERAGLDLGRRRHRKVSP